MIQWARDMAKRTPLRDLVLWWRRRQQERLNRDVPSQREKYEAIKSYSSTHAVRVMVETGTNEGDAVAACVDSFDRIYSIELAHELFVRASSRFRGDNRVEILEGDSTHVLPIVLERINEPALFWLDGHYSGGNTAKGEQDTPVEAELRAILSHPVDGHVVLVDDARLFTGRNGYPTIARVRKIVRDIYPEASYDVENDIIRVILR